jgi:hypothetical protein
MKFSQWTSHAPRSGGPNQSVGLTNPIEDSPQRLGKARQDCNACYFDLAKRAPEQLDQADLGCFSPRRSMRIRNPEFQLISARTLRGDSMAEWFLSRRDSTIVARHEHLFSVILRILLVLVVVVLGCFIGSTSEPLACTSRQKNIRGRRGREGFGGR